MSVLVYVLVSFVVGVGIGIFIGSFRTKRKTEFLLKAHGMIDGVTKTFDDFWDKFNFKK